MTRIDSRIVIATIALLFAPKAACSPPSVLDALLLPESKAGDIYNIQVEYLNRGDLGDELMDAALAATEDPRFAVGTRGREQLWSLLSEVTHRPSGHHIWREDHLAELLVALEQGSVGTKLRVLSSFQRAKPTLHPQVVSILRDRLHAEKDMWALVTTVETLGRFPSSITPEDRSRIIAMITDLGAVSPDLVVSNTEYGNRGFHQQGRSRLEYQLAREGAKILLYSGANLPAALNAVTPIEQINKGAIAEAMLVLALDADSIFAAADLVERGQWLSAASGMFSDPSAIPLVQCCLVEFSDALYRRLPDMTEQISVMLISAIEAHSIDPRIKPIAADTITLHDSVTPLPPSWSP